MWLWLMQIGWIGFLLAMWMFIWRGYNREGKLQTQAWRWIVVAVFCFVLWVVALPQIPRP
jgi:hypothetical protein